MAEIRQSTSLRPGTQANQRSILGKFVRFLASHNLDYREPTDEGVCIFFEYCLITVKAPATVRNYNSSLASAYRQMGLADYVFESQKVKNALASIDRNVRHTPSPALPVTPAILRRVIKIAQRLQAGATLTVAYVFMFHTFCRVSNFAPVTSAEFDATRQFTRGDVRMHLESIVVKHKWSKSHQSAGHSAAITIPRIPDSLLCPCRAFTQMLREIPTRHPNQPLLMFSDGSAVPAPYIRKVWNTILDVCRIPHSRRYSIHGIRRGAAHHIIRNDPSARDDVKRHGLWRSDIVDVYLPDTSLKVYKVMKQTL